MSPAGAFLPHPTKRKRFAGGPSRAYLMPAVSSSMAVVSDLGLSMG